MNPRFILHEQIVVLHESILVQSSLLDSNQTEQLLLGLFGLEELHIFADEDRRAHDVVLDLFPLHD